MAERIRGLRVEPTRPSHICHRVISNREPTTAWVAASALPLSVTCTALAPAAARVSVMTRNLPQRRASSAAVLPCPPFWLKLPQPSALVKGHLKFSGVRRGLNPK
jgi:hypothetical protein